jgi:hypothetical protein
MFMMMALSTTGPLAQLDDEEVAGIAVCRDL